MSYVYACTAVGQALMDAFPQSNFVPKLVGLLNAGAMVADYVVSKQIARFKQQRDEQNKQNCIVEKQINSENSGTEPKANTFRKKVRLLMLTASIAPQRT